jgi:multisubunit Na+/H+ antiporter MnhB subunit
MTVLVVGILLFSISAGIGAHPKEEWEEPVRALGWYGSLVCAALLAAIGLSALLFVSTFFLNRRLPRDTSKSSSDRGVDR